MATWNVTNCDYAVSLNGKANVVTNLHWDCTDEDEAGNAGRIYGSVGVQTDDLSDFTEWAAITKDQAVQWTKDTLGAESVEQIEQAVQQQIQALAEPIMYRGRPWVQPSS